MDKNHVDTTQTTHVSLCSGYGGIDLGLKRSIKSLRTIAYAEIEAFACEVLLARMEGGQLDAAPIWSDLKSFPWTKFRGLVDIISGGYPCQPFSAAGKRLGTEDPRHLWPFIADGIRILRPKLCFFENVEGHIGLGLREVIGELEQMGYRVSWGIFSATEVGAPHQRKRVFILAKRSGERGAAGIPRQVAWDERGAGIADNGGSQNIWPSRPGQQQYEWEPPRVVANTHKHGNGTSIGRETRQGSGKLHNESTGLGNASGWSNGQQPTEQQGRDTSGRSGEESGAMGNANSPRPQERPRQRGAGIQGTHADGGTDAERQIEPPLGRDADGSARGMDYAKLCESCDNRTDELRLLGNGVVPATAERAFRVLMAKLKEEA